LLRPSGKIDLDTPMPLRYWIRIVELTFAVGLALAWFFSWRADRSDRMQLAAELASTKQLVAAADAQQHTRDAQLAETLKSLAAEKRTIVTPAQVIRQLPRELNLPSPIVLQSIPANSSSATPSAQTGNPAIGNEFLASNAKPAPSRAILPAEDLKPLYDFTIDCKACQAKLTAAHSDLADEQKKTSALTKERDDALRIAKGGTAWRRIARAAKWLLIGAAAGALAAKSAR
jgi:phage terminase Nu1 subunit (DNA packaging protein)